MKPPEDSANQGPAAGLMGRLLPFGVLVAWSIVFPLATYAIVALDQLNDHPDSCYGIGWGCVPDASASAVLAMVFVGGPVLIVAFLAVAVTTILGASFKARMWVAAAGPLVAWLGLAFIDLAG